MIQKLYISAEPNDTVAKKIKKANVMCISFPQGIQYVGDFVSSAEHKRRFLTQTVAVCQSYNAS